MAKQSGWSKEVYEASVSSRCWWFTPHDDGWDGSRRHGVDLPADDELRGIVAMECELGAVPEWAQRVVEGSFHSLPPCGHYLFPRAYLDAVSAIGSEAPPAFLHTCFTVERRRKGEMVDYCLCLDAWLAGAPPDGPARELMALGHRRIDWLSVCADLWKVLGEHTELKGLLVERTLHQTRWWVKSSVWDDDLAADFGRDEYLGDYSETGCYATDNGNPDLRAPTFRQDASPRIQRLEARLAEICADWEWFRRVIVEFSWPCAPKAFRYMEGLLWSIGKEGPAVALPDYPLENAEEVPGFLRCEDTWPDQDKAAQWWRSFLGALRGWWRGQPEKGHVAEEVNQCLGEVTPVKRWLVRLLVRRLDMLERHSGILGQLVNPPPTSKRGTGPVG